MPLEDQKSELDAIARLYAARVTQGLETFSREELFDLLREIDEMLRDNSRETN